MILCCHGHLACPPVPLYCARPRVTPKYVLQLQHLIVVTNARACHYVSYRLKEIVVAVVANSARMKRIVR
jgi:hypothetical protein